MKMQSQNFFCAVVMIFTFILTTQISFAQTSNTKKVVVKNEVASESEKRMPKLMPLNPATVQTSAADSSGQKNQEIDPKSLKTIDKKPRESNTDDAKSKSKK